MIFKKMNTNNNSVTKRKSMKKKMYAGSSFNVKTDIQLLNSEENTEMQQRMRIERIQAVMPQQAAETLPTISHLEPTLLLDKNFIINTYFTTGTKWFYLENYTDIYNNDKWNTKLLARFINVYNKVYISLFYKVFFMDISQIRIGIEKWPVDKPQNILDDVYVAYLLQKFGLIYISPKILKIVRELNHKDDVNCGIKRIDKYYKKYDETIGKGGFGTLFRCTKTEVIKFINPPSILNNNANRSSIMNGTDVILNIVSFLNEVTITITLNSVNDVLFKKPHSFGYKNMPNESIRTLNDGPKEIVLDETDENYVEPTIFPGKFYIIMDDMGETLENKLTGTIKIDIKVKLQYLKNLVDGLTIIHENNFFHCDIKSINILVGQDNIARFIDFGISKLITNSNSIWQGSTPDWTAPNQTVTIWGLRGKQLLNVDIYQLGLVFYFFLLEDNDFLKDRPTDDTTTSVDLYNFFDNMIIEKKIKTEENADMLNFYRHIMSFIRNNEMLTFENFQNVPAPDSKCRMNTIKRNFKEMYKIFVKDNRHSGSRHSGSKHSGSRHSGSRHSGSRHSGSRP